MLHLPTWPTWVKKDEENCLFPLKFCKMKYVNLIKEYMLFIVHCYHPHRKKKLTRMAHKTFFYLQTKYYFLFQILP